MKKEVLGNTGYSTHVIIAKLRERNETKIVRVYASSHAVDIHRESLSKSRDTKKLRVIKLADLKRFRK